MFTLYSTDIDNTTLLTITQIFRHIDNYPELSLRIAVVVNRDFDGVSLVALEQGKDKPQAWFWRNAPLERESLLQTIAHLANLHIEGKA